MKPGPEVLERNLEALLQRAYVPAMPRESFRRALQQDFVDRASARAGTSPAGRVLPFRRSLVFRSVLAAAAVLLVFFGLQWLRDEPADARSPQAFLAAGSVAVRHAPDGAWEGAAPETAFAPDARFLELATPTQHSAHVALASGAIELEPASQAAFHGTGPEDAPAVSLLRGGLRASASEALDIRTPEGAVTLLSGSLHIVAEVPAQPPADWLGTPGRGWWSVECLAGRVALPTGADAAALTLLAGERAFLRGGRAWLPPPSALGAATPVAGEGRREVAAAAVASEPEAEVTAAPEPPVVAEVQPPVLYGLVLEAAGSGAGGVDEPDKVRPVERFQLILLEQVSLPRVAQPTLHSFEHPEGAFDLSDVAPGSYQLFVRAEGFALWRSSQFLVRPGAEPLELHPQLEPGRGVRGIVLDGETGRPLAGAIVLSETDAPLQILAVDAADHPAGVLVSTVTGADGGFELEHLSSGAQVLRASAPGFAPSWSGRLEADASGLLPPVEFELEAGGTIVGVVEDEAGRAVVGSQIVTSLTDFTSAHPVMTYVGTQTDEQGHFEMRDLPDGAWAVLEFGVITDSREAQAPDIAFAQVFAGETAEVNFKSPLEGVRLHGIVTDPAGRAIAGPAIWMTLADARGPESMQSMTTGADGSYEFAVPPERYQLSISGAVPLDMLVLAEPDLTSGLDLKLNLRLPGGSLSGSVRHAQTGEALGDLVLVCLRSGSAGESESFVATTSSAVDGSFELANLQPGRYVVVAYSTNGLAEERSQVFEVGEQPSETVELELWPGGALELTVVGPEGPVAGAYVRLQRRGGNWVRFNNLQRTTAQGRFLVGGLHAETWTVVISAGGFETAFETLVIPLGETLRTTVTLRPR